MGKLCIVWMKVCSVFMLIVCDGVEDLLFELVFVVYWFVIKVLCVCFIVLCRVRIWELCDVLECVFVCLILVFRFVCFR